MLPRYLFVLISSVLALSACQQAAWKAGASADDFKRDEQACRLQVHEDSAAIKECLRGQGWTVADFSAPADESAEATGDNTAAATPAPNSPVPAPLNKSVSEVAASANPVNSAAHSSQAIIDKPLATSSAVQANAAGTPALPTSVAPSANAMTTPAAKRLPPDPLQRQSVQTWWKAGAQASDFNGDANVCLEKLGEQHTPDYKQHLYTHAMVGCLRERGWYAGTDPVYTPLR